MKSIQLPTPFFFEQGKRAVILLHGYSGSSNDVRMLGRFLESNDYTVYAPHFSGHATTNPEDILESSPKDWWQDTTDAIQFLKGKGYEQIVVLGFSLGGIFAMKAAENFELLGAGTICSPLFLSDSVAIEARFIDYLKKVKKYNGISEDEIEEKIADNEADLGQQLDTINRYLPEIQEHLKDVTIPVFLAQAGEDELINPENVNLLKNALGSRQISFHWYQKSSHVITVGVCRHELQRDILTYLNQLPWNEEKNEK